MIFDGTHFAIHGISTFIGGSVGKYCSTALYFCLEYVPCKCAYLYICICIYLFMCVFACMFICENRNICAPLYMDLCLYEEKIYMKICKHTYAHM